MNLVLVRQEELEPGNRITLGDGRARHILSVLKAGPGATVRVGLLDGPLGLATVERVEGERVVLSCVFEGDAPEVPRLELLLAVPRPKVLNRLWPQLAALGVGRIVLTNAARVERCYFDSHVLRNQLWREPLIEGLQQAADTILPEVTIHRRFKVFTGETLDRLFPDHARLMADPAAPDRLDSVWTPAPEQRVLLAVGPEGGWNDFEIERLRGKGFQTFNLGPRILRSDTACLAALTLIHHVLTDRLTPP